MAAACLGMNPERFIRGIVKDPVAYTLATVLPLTVPYKALAMMAIFAAPPLAHPAAQMVKLMKKFPTPAKSMKLAKMM